MISSRDSSGRAGDALVFLPGERDIRELAKALRHNERLRVLPLYARLSQAEQNRVFSSGGAGMRVVLATNVAETSLTVPGIRYVIDPGEARISRYSVRSRLQRLPIEPISRASANQRMGRCGRVAEGVCLRLYSESDFDARPEFTDPEIRRTNLAAVVLRMLELRLGDVARFLSSTPPMPKLSAMDIDCWRNWVRSQHRAALRHWVGNWRACRWILDWGVCFWRPMTRVVWPRCW